MDASAPDLPLLSPSALRALIRAGDWAGPTAGLAKGFLQCNLAILPQDHANAFHDWCQANPKICPLVAVGEPGSPNLPALSADIDLRTDLPGYSIFRNGKPASHETAVADLWADDLVAFAFGCSFSFEEVLLEEGVALDYLARGEREAIYRSTIQTAPAVMPRKSRYILNFAKKVRHGVVGKMVRVEQYYATS